MVLVRSCDVGSGTGIDGAFEVAIDTEGYDALVLEGMKRALRKRAVEFVEFE